MADELNIEYTPELNKLALDQILKKVEEQKLRDIAAAKGRAGARGLAGSSYEANQIAGAERGAQDAATNAAVQMALANAANVREERLIKEGRTYQTSERVAGQAFQTSERVGSQDFAAQQAELQRQYQALEQQKQNAYAAGENEKAREFEAKQADIQRQFEAAQAGSQRAWEGAQNAKQRKVDVITGLASATGQGIGMFAGLCFGGDSMVEMADGSHKPIKDIRLGNETKGGPAMAWRECLSNHVYEYKGVRVSAMQAVKTPDGWKRVMDCDGAKHLPGFYVVYNLVTPSHRMYINGIEFTDEFEFDDPYRPLEESLNRLNEDEKVVI